MVGKFVKKGWKPKNRGLMLLASETMDVSVYKEEKHFSAFKVRDEKRNYLLIVVHLASAMYRDVFSRAQRANMISREIQKLEEACNQEAQRAGETRFSTIVAGDFNLQPFSDGVISMHGFNAVMDADIAKKIERHMDYGNVKYYYNPMWQLMGKRNGVPGTYFSYSDHLPVKFELR